MDRVKIENRKADLKRLKDRQIILAYNCKPDERIDFIKRISALEGAINELEIILRQVKEEKEWEIILKEFMKM